MKKGLVLILCLMMAVATMGCGESDNKTYSSVDDIIAEQTADDTSVEEEIVEEDVTNDSEEDQFTLDEETIEGDPSVDLDLTALSSTMVYSEVFNMMMAPLEYKGKTIKISGNCNIYEDQDTGKKYYACIVQDATQCCSQGLEFVLDEEKYSEKDYPENGESITIKGEFSTYKENGNEYLTILGSVIE